MAEKKRLLQILDLIKMLPRTNCKECGYPTCMAFATYVLREGEDPAKCPYWRPEDLAFVKQSLISQGEDSAYPDHLFSARKFVQGKIKEYDFSTVAKKIGARLVEDEAGDYLIVNLLERLYRVDKERVEPLDEGEHDLWEHILLYNYVAEAGGRPLTGNWVPMESLPGSLAKRKVFVSGCEEKIAAAYSGQPELLRQSLKVLKADFPELESNAEVAAVFHPLPMIPFQLLFWDADLDDGFSAQVKILFDETVLDYLDIESLVFLGDKCAERLKALRS
ncbi:MAG: DUF3786 domain-containing protein [Deltaproteobacteria bacterium]|nr:DUF3786 domain-containing protein [Candidatus Tharpella aukensis]